MPANSLAERRSRQADRAAKGRIPGGTVSRPLDRSLVDNNVLFILQGDPLDHGLPALREGHDAQRKRIFLAIAEDEVLNRQR